MSTMLYDSDVYTDNVDPGTNINPKKNGSIWVNYNTGTVWICKDNTINKNVWIKTKTNYDDFNPAEHINGLVGLRRDGPYTHGEIYMLGHSTILQNVSPYNLQITFGGNLYPNVTQDIVRYTSPNREFFSFPDQKTITANKQLFINPTLNENYKHFKYGVTSGKYYDVANSTYTTTYNKSGGKSPLLKPDFTYYQWTSVFNIPPGWYYSITASYLPLTSDNYQKNDDYKRIYANMLLIKATNLNTNGNLSIDCLEWPVDPNYPTSYQCFKIIQRVSNGTLYNYE